MRCQLEPDAVGVVEVDRADEVMVHHADHVDTCCFKPRFRVLQRGLIVYLKREMIDPTRCIRRRRCNRVVAQIEEREMRTVAQLEKKCVRTGSIRRC